MERCDIAIWRNRNCVALDVNERERSRHQSSVGEPPQGSTIAVSLSQKEHEGLDNPGISPMEHRKSPKTNTFFLALLLCNLEGDCVFTCLWFIYKIRILSDLQY